TASVMSDANGSPSITRCVRVVDWSRRRGKPPGRRRHADSRVGGTSPRGGRSGASLTPNRHVSRELLPPRKSLMSLEGFFVGGLPTRYFSAIARTAGGKRPDFSPAPASEIWFPPGRRAADPPNLSP